MSAPPEPGWQRFHPLSPLLRGGLLLLAVVGYLASQLVEDLLGGVTGRAEGGPDGGWEASAGEHPLLAVAAVALVVLGVVAVAAASWWFTRYRLGPSTIELTQGVLFRRHRQARYAQIQAVSTTQPLLARLVGLAEVRVESAGGGDSHMSLAYLDRRSAAVLRDQLLGLAERAGADPVGAGADGDARDESTEVSPDGLDRSPAAGPPSAPGPPPPAGPPPPPVVSMPFGRLLASTVLTLDTLVITVLVVLGLGVGALFGQVAVTGFVVPLLLYVVGKVRRLLTWGNLTMRVSGRTLASQHGLTELATSTVPLHRVQAVELTQPLLWRRPDWWSVAVNIAGVKVGGDTVVEEGVIVPAASRAEAERLLGVLSTTMDTTPARSVMRDGLPPQAVGCPPSARLLDPWAWRRRGVLLADEVAVVRSGRLARVVTVVPWGRIQSVEVSQGPLARRLGLADVRLVSTVGAVRPLAQHLAARDAQEVAEEMRARSRARRAGPTPSAPSRPLPSGS